MPLQNELVPRGNSFTANLFLCGQPVDEPAFSMGSRRQSANPSSAGGLRKSESTSQKSLQIMAPSPFDTRSERFTETTAGFILNHMRV